MDIAELEGHSPFAVLGRTTDAKEIGILLEKVLGHSTRAYSCPVSGAPSSHRLISGVQFHLGWVEMPATHHDYWLGLGCALQYFADEEARYPEVGAVRTLEFSAFKIGAHLCVLMKAI